MAGEGKDTIDQMIDQIKKLEAKIKKLESSGADTEALQNRIAELEEKLQRNPNFGSWD